MNCPRIERTREHLLIDIIPIAILAVITGTEGWVTIETYGKTLKQAYDRSQGQKALHIVSPWSSSHQLVLGQQKFKHKSNEIRVISTLPIRSHWGIENILH